MIQTDIHDASASSTAFRSRQRRVPRSRVVHRAVGCHTDGPRMVA